MQLNKIVMASVIALGCASLRAADTDIKITEVDPSGSSTAGYAADWFEITNTGSATVNLTGWTMDDSGPVFGTAPLRGVTNIAPGQSVVFIDGGAAGANTATTDATLEGKFITAWFGAAGAPAGFTIGAYGGSSVGLSTSGDEVNLYNSAQVSITGVAFGATTANVTLDNSVALIGGTDAATRPIISTNSVSGTNGAFTTTETTPEIGSPGRIANAVTPEPASLALFGFGATALLARRRKVAH